MHQRRELAVLGNWEQLTRFVDDPNKAQLVRHLDVGAAVR